MKRRICVAVGEGSLDNALRLALAAADRADVIEIRLDLIADAQLSPFFTAIKTPLLFTNRAQWEGGNFKGDEETRIAPLLEAINKGAAYVDLELMAPQQSWDLLKGAARLSGTKLISSWHNFNGTPNEEELVEKLKAMQKSGAAIGKIITMARDFHDVLSVLHLQTLAAKMNFQLIAFCMGEAGVISRVATCQLGGYMTYSASDEGQSTAPGQISLGALLDIYQLLKR